ncbi:hypothetical protein [Microvirga pudoricolor]|uniref:hypothetical protein n=1 Tax=Microvirga pudoricolor TaxID=2778729 RepID=UPI00194EFF24|nr:hypothetical protein [Microvirga pudoricolor]MBM6594870.1 hypothetical protein [Microvirga pudoricolor]
MSPILPADVIAAIGPADPLIVNEIVQTRASWREWQQAMRITSASEACHRQQGGQLNGRLKRLIDLLSVVNGRGRGDGEP